MTRYMANAPESSFFTDVLKIALGVFIGGLLAALAYTKIIAMGVEYAATQANAAMQRDLQKMKAQQEQARRAAEQQRIQQETQRQAMLAAVNAQAQQRQLEQEQNRLELEKRMAFESRRDAAWKRSFKPSQLCQDDPLTAECIDARNISQRRFIAQYRE